LRDLSLAESGNLKLNLTPANLADLARRKLSQFEPASREKGIQLELDSAPDIPEIKVDIMRMDQIIANLLSNALRHTPEGGTVSVALRTNNTLQVGKPALILSITDTGEGIPEEHLPHLFERFYRVENSRSRSEGGVGLGLSIVKQMVQAHKGQVWAESVPGKGSSFYVALPVDD